MIYEVRMVSIFVVLLSKFTIFLQSIIFVARLKRSAWMTPDPEQEPPLSHSGGTTDNAGSGSGATAPVV